MTMNAIKFLAACAALAGAAAAFAQNPLPLVDAEVRKVEPATQTVTLSHGDIPNVGMGAMTMVFRVKDPAMLSKVRAGDKVKFTADKVDGVITVVSIEVTGR